MAEIIIYTTKLCPYCVRAKHLLDKKEVSYTEIRIDEHPEKADEMTAKSQRRSVPQIFINQSHIGGCDDLYALERDGTLDKLLS